MTTVFRNNTVYKPRLPIRREIVSIIQRNNARKKSIHREKLLVLTEVQIVNINNGERFETYVIKGAKDSGTICLNGPAARRVAMGDVIIIIGYGFMDFEEAKTFKPALVFPNEETNLLD